jgi:hypothetical protein
VVFELARFKWDLETRFIVISEIANFIVSFGTEVNIFVGPYCILLWDCLTACQIVSI